MSLTWKIKVDAKSEAKSLKLLGRVMKRMEKTASNVIIEPNYIEPYPKTKGFIVGFSTELESVQWNDAVVETIDLGQRIGHEWQLSGYVYDELWGYSNRTWNGSL